MDDIPTPDPEIRSPLARYHGGRPPGPMWFEQAIAERPERSFVDVEGAAIELLTWGERGRPGLLFIHGGRAHADWWSCIAPFFAQDYRVAALSLSGMGRSDWRALYSMELYAREAMAAADAAGLFDSDTPPIFAGHSFGGWVNMHVAAEFGARLNGAVILDSALFARRSLPEDIPQSSRPTRVYPTLEAALARFRLVPEQSCENHYLLDYIAREALKPARLPLEDATDAPDARDETGWTWRFDPSMSLPRTSDFFDKIERSLRAPSCPLALVWGDRSRIVTKDLLVNTLASAPLDMRRLMIPDAAHHLFLDQPLAVVAGLRGLLSSWPVA